MMRALLLASLTLALFATIGTVEAAVIGFDDVPRRGNIDYVPNGYLSLNYSNVFVYGGDTFGGGFAVGIVSPSNAILNGGGNLATISSATPFELNSAYFTALRDEVATVLGYVNGVQTYSSSFMITSTAPTLEAFNWAGLSSFTFIGDGGYASYVVIDDLAVNQVAAVPEPASLALLGMGVAGIAAARRRRAA